MKYEVKELLFPMKISVSLHIELWHLHIRVFERGIYRVIQIQEKYIKFISLVMTAVEYLHHNIYLLSGNIIINNFPLHSLNSCIRGIIGHSQYHCNIVRDKPFECVVLW